MLKVLEKMMEQIDNMFDYIIQLYSNYSIGTFIISILAVIFIKTIGTPDHFLVGWCVMIIADWTTGILVSGKEGTMSSEKGTNGVKKKLGMLVLLIAGNVLDNTFGIQQLGFNVRIFLLGTFIGLEGFSIMENLNLLGVKIPKKIWQIFNRLVENGDGKKSRGGSNGVQDKKKER